VMYNLVMKYIGVIGGGAWGTAIACAVSRAGFNVKIWATEADVVDEINNYNRNSRYLSGVLLPKNITASSNYMDFLACESLFFVPPSQFLRSVILNFRGYTGDVIICSKGIEKGSLMLMSEVAEDVLGREISVMAGPSFAIEVAENRPTSVNMAGANDDALAKKFSSPNFSIHSIHDKIAVEIGSSIKNVIAVACGFSIAKGAGKNFVAALITEGLNEIVELIKAKGGSYASATSLAVIGDLMLTCYGDSSRNFNFGKDLANGLNVEQIKLSRHTVAEGAENALSIHDISMKYDVKLTVCEVVYRLVCGGISPDDAYSELNRVV
jgi:glycerol-3-phosphate dehydrogenase (NAD(P)+)